MRDVDYDRLVSVFVLTCGKELDDSSLICQLFFAQKLGFNLDFNFRVNQRGVSSSKADNYLRSLVVDGNLSVDSTKSTYTYPVHSVSDRVMVCGEDFFLLEDLKDLLSDLDGWELSFIVTLAILQEDIMFCQGSDKRSFTDYKEEVISAMKRLCVNYTDELFDAASERLLNIYNLKER